MRLGIRFGFAPSTFVGCALLVLGCNGRAASSTPSGGGTSTTTCEDGTERCACYGNSTCDAGLVCLSDLCVKPANSASGGATSTSVGQGGAVALGQGGSLSMGLGGATLVTAIGGATSTALAAGGSSSGGLPGVGGMTSSGGTVASSGGLTTSSGAVAAFGGTNSSAGIGTAGTSAIAGASGHLASAGSWTNGGGAGSAGTTASLATGGAIAAGGTSTTGGSATGGAAPGACAASTNLIAEALKSSATNWIGGDPTSPLDNPCGVQGKVYAFSDMGLDYSPGNADDSVQWPFRDTASSDAMTRLSPCNMSKNGCCISGATSKWPVLVSGTTDYTASVWGGGIGVSLNDPGSGGTLAAYQGPITGFNLTVSGTLNGQVLRIGFPQSPTDQCPPFVQKSSVGTFQVPFLGTAACPTWSCAPACIPATATPYALRVEVVGGDAAGSFDICITSITPIL